MHLWMQLIDICFVLDVVMKIQKKATTTTTNTLTRTYNKLIHDTIYFDWSQSFHLFFGKQLSIICRPGCWAAGPHCFFFVFCFHFVASLLVNLFRVYAFRFIIILNRHIYPHMRFHTFFTHRHEYQHQMYIIMPPNVKLNSTASVRTYVQSIHSALANKIVLFDEQKPTTTTTRASDFRTFRGNNLQDINGLL